MIKETGRPPACRPPRTGTEGEVCDGRDPRAQTHKNVGCPVCALHWEDIVADYEDVGTFSSKKALNFSHFRRSYGLCEYVVYAQNQRCYKPKTTYHKAPVGALRGSLTNLVISFHTKSCSALISFFSFLKFQYMSKVLFLALLISIEPYGEQSIDTLWMKGAWVAFPLKSPSVNCNEVRSQKKKIEWKGGGHTPLLEATDVETAASQSRSDSFKGIYVHALHLVSLLCIYIHRRDK